MKKMFKVLALLALVSWKVPAWADNTASLVSDGNSAYGSKEYDRALRLYRAAAGLDDHSSAAYQGEGNSLLALGKHREALSAYRHALDLAPQDQGLEAVIQRLERESNNWYNQTGLSLGGPRWGVLYLMPRDKDFETYKADVKVSSGIDLKSPFVSVFGWQFEWRFVTTDSGWTALSEFIPTVAGLDQGLAIPSLNWLLGFRKRSGFELGAGPNFSAGGVGFILGTGYTFGSEQLNFPVNLAYAMSKEVTRATVSVGFNLPNFNWLD